MYLLNVGPFRDPRGYGSSNAHPGYNSEPAWFYTIQRQSDIAGQLLSILREEGN